MINNNFVCVGTRLKLSCNDIVFHCISKIDKLVKSYQDGYGKRVMYKALWFYRIETIQVVC